MCHVILDFVFQTQNGNEISKSRMTKHVTPKTCDSNPPISSHNFTTQRFLSDVSFSEVVCSLFFLSNDMKVLVLLALVALAAAFDFPEEWEAWKKVLFTSGVRCSVDYHSYLSLSCSFSAAIWKAVLHRGRGATTPRHLAGKQEIR